MINFRNTFNLLSFNAFQRKEPQITNTKPVLMSLDIDNTLIPWKQEPAYDEVAFQRYRQTFHNAPVQNNNFIVLNTGRSLSSIKRLAPELSKIPFNAIALNDGQELYIKKKNDPLTLLSPQEQKLQCLKKLTLANQDPIWKAHFKKWSVVHVNKDVQHFLKKEGYKLIASPGSNKHPEFTESDVFVFAKPQQPNSEHQWLVKIRPDQTSFEITEANAKASPAEIAQLSEALCKDLGLSLKKRWPQLENYTNHGQTASNIHLSPKGNNKASLINHLVVNRLQQRPVAVISAGDSDNDTALLATPTFDHVPNYPILVGNNPSVLAQLEQHPLAHLEKVEWNQLNEGIKRQYATLEPQLKQFRRNEASKIKPKLDKFG